MKKKKNARKDAKKYSYTKDCKEQPRKSLIIRFPGRAVVKHLERNVTKDCKDQPKEIPDQCNKKCLKPVCVVHDRFACTYE